MRAAQATRTAEQAAGEEGMLSAGRWDLAPQQGTPPVLRMPSMPAARSAMRTACAARTPHNASPGGVRATRGAGAVEAQHGEDGHTHIGDDSIRRVLTRGRLPVLSPVVAMWWAVRRCVSTQGTQAMRHGRGTSEGPGAGRRAGGETTAHGRRRAAVGGTALARPRPAGCSPSPRAARTAPRAVRTAARAAA